MMISIGSFGFDAAVTDAG